MRYIKKIAKNLIININKVAIKVKKENCKFIKIKEIFFFGFFIYINKLLFF